MGADAIKTIPAYRSTAAAAAAGIQLMIVDACEVQACNLHVKRACDTVMVRDDLRSK